MLEGALKFVLDKELRGVFCLSMINMLPCKHKLDKETNSVMYFCLFIDQYVTLLTHFQTDVLLFSMLSIQNDILWWPFPVDHCNKSEPTV